MNNLINFIDLVDVQKSERYKALLIYGNMHVMTSDVGKQLSNILKSSYINIVDDCIAESELAMKIDTFDTDELKSYLRQRIDSNESVAIIDGIDMLWNTWSLFEKEKFLKMLEKNSISPYRHTVFIFLCVKNEIMKSLAWFNDANHTPRVMDLNEIMSGGHF